MVGLRYPKPTRRRDKRRSRVPAVLKAYRALEKRADRLWSFLVRHKSPFCVRCKIRPTAQADHLVSRRYRRTRWDVAVGVPLCAGCHMTVTADTLEHARLAEDVLGRARWEALSLLARVGGKVDPALAIVTLGEEIRQRGLTALAVERGLL